MVAKGGPTTHVTVDTTRDELSVPLERALLVSVALPDRPWIGSDPMAELRGLATTAGASVVGSLLLMRPRGITGTCIGKGKVAEPGPQDDATEGDGVIFAY